MRIISIVSLAGMVAFGGSVRSAIGQEVALYQPEMAAVYEAAGSRDTQSRVFEEAVADGYASALELLGQMGGEVCPRLMPYLRSKNNIVRISAMQGVSNCRYQVAFDAVFAAASVDADPLVRAAALRALGFITSETNRPQFLALANLVILEGKGPLVVAALNGLIQHLAYVGATPAELKGLDLNALVKASGALGPVGLEAAYLLSRLQGLLGVIAVEEVEGALEAASDSAQKFVLLRVLGSFGDAAVPTLIKYAEAYVSVDANERRVAVGAMRAMAGLSDQQSFDFLLRVLESETQAQFKQLALTALAGRVSSDPKAKAVTESFLRDQNEWLAVTALTGLLAAGEPMAQPIALDWLQNDSFYKAYRVLTALAGTEDGRAALRAFVERDPHSLRAKIVAAALDPDVAPNPGVRATAPYLLAHEAVTMELVLDTTRGEIVIEMIDGAPYAALNFLELARVGALDGMLWHRVIPGFVAQAGEMETASGTPTIREEWGAALHEPGTVGVATSGPDTGSNQFFINLEPNRHLDDRYTVFGRVVSGDYYAVQEGDLIIRAYVRGQEAL
jgi:cyclophilin family peptidyl-prolyl cis-trans isomerase